MAASYNILAYYKDDFLKIVLNIVQIEKCPFRLKSGTPLLKFTLIYLVLIIFVAVLFHALVGPWFNTTIEIYYFQRWTKHYKFLTSLVYLFFFLFLVGVIVLPIQWYTLYTIYFITQLDKLTDAVGELGSVTENDGSDGQVKEYLKQYFKHFIWIKK